MFVKICGITCEEDALLAVAQGADAVGFVFAPSTRQIAASLARDIARRLPAEVLTVGVFRNEAAKRVVEICHAAGLRAAQLHGHESRDDTRFVRERVGLVIKGFSAGSPDLDRFDDYGADIALIDSPEPGSGQVFDWSLAEGAPPNRRVLLAGGLNPDNVAEAIRRVRPWGVDVSSGVEVRPGRKDALKVSRFVVNAKAAGAQFVVPSSVEDSEGPAPFDWQRD
jgi:phosphoribosylanthranilate isomerase